MLTRNHWELAKHICGKHELIRRYGFMVKLGSIMPDINLLTYIKGHTPDKRLAKASKQLTQMVETGCPSWPGAYRLGVVIHYLADSFTYTHNRCFLGCIQEHFEYEERLMPCFRNALQRSSVNNHFPVDIEAYLQGRHAAYLNEEHTLETDADYIIETVLRLCNVIAESWSKNSSKVMSLEMASSQSRAEYGLEQRP